ncbi:hypothetical protein NC99_24740 [Sunxiuqinia dokdonensis]|uniref:Tetracyclin repressor-like C-terminal domain-containing protein n=2 Tax=Sunxiuqinia dokdonensis TaxID=1409788 RepID=A0A0L8V8C8_9BACT|nr:hypothetical protein NC99_24740 [Sunxiuqinia dokdonensis]
MAGTSLSDIMDATQLAKGCLYGNFDNKEEICLESFNFLTQRYAAELKAYLGAYPAGKARLLAYLDFSLQSKFRDENGGCPVINFGAEADDTNPVIRERVRQTIRGMQEMLKQMIADAVDLGEIKSSADPELLALKFYTMLEGAVLISRVENSNTQLEQITKLIQSEIEEISQ